MDNLYGLNLQLFAGEGGAEGGEAGQAESNAEVTEVAEGAAQTAEAQTEVDPETEFEDLIKTKFKDQFTKKTQKIINERFKETKKLQSDKDKLSPLMSLMSERLGVDANDIEGLIKAYTTDEAYIDHVAVQEGISSDEARNRISKAAEDKTREIELNRLRAESAEREAEEARRERFNAWKAEADALTEVYPGLDFANEIGNGDFVRSLQMFSTNGFQDPFRQAFEHTHRAEILSGAMQQAVKAGADAAAKSKATTRPIENGVGGSQGASTKVDVNNLTPSQIMEILKKVERGETVSF